MAPTYKTFSSPSNRIVVHEVANSTVVIVGNNTVSNVCSSATEVVHGASISKVIYGSQGGAWLIGRGNSSVNSIVGVFNETGIVDFAEEGMLLDVSKTGLNMYLTLVGTANGFIMVELKKDSIINAA